MKAKKRFFSFVVFSLISSQVGGNVPFTFRKALHESASRRKRSCWICMYGIGGRKKEKNKQSQMRNQRLFFTACKEADIFKVQEDC